MSLNQQNSSSRLGLNLVERLRNERTALVQKKAPKLDPGYPFTVIPFDPKFFGIPAPLDAGDGQN
jgi:hypothetical protein